MLIILRIHTMCWNPLDLLLLMIQILKMVHFLIRSMKTSKLTCWEGTDNSNQDMVRTSDNSKLPELNYQKRQMQDMV